MVKYMISFFQYLESKLNEAPLEGIGWVGDWESRKRKYGWEKESLHRYNKKGRKDIETELYNIFNSLSSCFNVFLARGPRAKKMNYYGLINVQKAIRAFRIKEDEDKLVHCINIIYTHKIPRHINEVIEDIIHSVLNSKSRLENYETISDSIFKIHSRLHDLLGGIYKLWPLMREIDSQYTELLSRIATALAGEPMDSLGDFIAYLFKQYMKNGDVSINYYLPSSLVDDPQYEASHKAMTWYRYNAHKIEQEFYQEIKNIADSLVGLVVVI